VSVYVDRVELGYGRMVMCHMIADTPDELHAMADRIGVARRWFQAPPKASFWHYDIAKSKRALAVAAGAIDCDRNTFVGAPAPDPRGRRVRRLEGDGARRHANDRAVSSPAKSRLMTVDEVAERLRVSKRTAYRLVKEMVRAEIGGRLVVPEPPWNATSN
jgi:hypothetical protein